MNELNEEIKLTLNLMQTDIDDGAHSELQGHLYSLLEMKRNELQQRLTERSGSEPATYDDLSPYKTVIKPCGQIIGRAQPLTVEELKAGGWWCEDVSKECADAFKSKGLRVFNSEEWMCEGAWSGCVRDNEGDITRVFFYFDFEGKKQIHRVGNEFYWSKP